MRIQLDEDDVKRLKCQRCFTPSDHGVSVNELIMFLFDEALTGPVASTTASKGPVKTEWERAGDKWNRYRQSIPEEILSTKFDMGKHPRKWFLQTWYARSLEAVDIVVDKCQSGKLS